MAIRGTGGDDNLTGTSGNDNILAWQGGDDTIQAGDGNDIIRMGAALNAADKIDGGTGRDVVILNGDYSAGLVFNADTITNVEVLNLVGGHSYNLTLDDGNVAAGAGLLVKAGGLGIGDSLIFDGSAETDGQLAVVGGAGDDTITGGALSDHFRLENGGVDTAHGGGGNDVFYMGDQLWSDDQIDGGAEIDTVHVTGFAGGDTLVLTGTTMQNVEDFVLDGGTFLELITDDATVAAGATLTVDASAQTTNFLFDGSAETDGRFVVIGGSGDDNLTGGAGADTFHLENGGIDTVDGGGGTDHFFMGASLTSADQIEGGAGFDTVFVNGGAAVTFTATTITDVERIVLGAGHSYNFIENDANVAAGQNLTIDASALGASTRLQFHGSAETDEIFTFIGGAGNDQISGGLGADRFHLEHGGNDTADGGGGDDHFYMGASLNAADQIKGGLGYDTVILDGGAPVAFSATTMSGVEEIDLTAGHSYSLTTSNATVAFNTGMFIDASALGAGDTLTFDGAAETGGYFNIIGGAGNDVITGGQAGDYIDLSLGGNDTVTLGSTLTHYPNQVYLGAALTAADHIDGSTGFDIAILDGDYTGANAVVFDAATMVDVDVLVLAPGFSYDLTTNDGNVSAGGLMYVDGSNLGVGDSLKFDGSAETDGSFTLVDGLGNDVLKGGAGNDSLSFDGGGTDTGIGGGGDDFIDACGHFDVTDHFDGGTGTDTIELTASDAGATGYTGANALVLTASMMSNIEVMDLDPGGSYDITTVDANVAAGSSLTVDGSILGASDNLTFDGSAETDGSFILIDGLGNDVLKGGAGNDSLSFDAGGTDMGQGGGGNDFIDVCGHFDVTDQFDGGTGTDTIELTASDAGATGYTGANALVLTASMMSNIEVMQLDNGGSYDITTVDANVAAGSSLTVDGSSLGASDSLTFDGSAETDGTFDFIAGASLHTHLTGGAGNDTFDLTLADPAADTQAFGNGGNDTFQFLDNFDSSNQIIDGGTGTNTLSLDGDYSAISLVGSGIIDNIQTVTFAGGHSYTGIQVFDDVAGGGTLTFDATALQSGDAFGLDASLSTDAIHLRAGDGTYTVTGSAQGDTFDMGAHFTASDSIDGGAGIDTLTLDGDYSAGLTFGAATMVDVEAMSLVNGHSYNLVLDDANVAAGQVLSVNAGALTAGNALTFDGSAETDGSFFIYTGAGNDVVSGGLLGNSFVLSATGGPGGTDTVHGNGGDDITDAGATLDASDVIDGGAGTDTLNLQGDYSGGLTLGAGTLVGIETLQVSTGNIFVSYSYNLTSDDGNVAAGQTLAVDASGLVSTETLTFDGSAETDGSFAFTGGAGNDMLTGGAQNDTFDLSHGGNDTVHGGGGNDTFSFGAAFTIVDTVDGGTGSDTLVLDGNYSFGFSASNFTSIETLKVEGAFNYTLITDDNNVAAGATLTVDFSALPFPSHFAFYGSAETDGNFHFIAGGSGSAGQVQLTGGGGNDVFDLTASTSLTGSSFTGNGGNDTFMFSDNFNDIHMTGPIDGGAGNDTIELNGDYSGGLTFGASAFTSIETLKLDDGFSYTLATDDANVASGATLVVDASALTGLNALTFNGSAETDGNFSFIGGAGNDVLTGGALSDTFDLTFGGNDTVHGGDGSDLFNMGAAFTAADSIDGGADSTDAVNLSGDYTGASAVVFGAATMTNVEFLEVAAGHNYDLTTDDATVAAGQTLTVDASALSGSDTLIFNGSAETDGTFTFEVNDPNVLSDSQLTGGAGDDTLVLNGDFFTTGVAFNSATIQSIENITLTAGNSYALSLSGDSVATGGSIAIDGSTLGAGDHFNFGFDTTGGGDSSYTLTGGAGDDAFFMLDAFTAADKIDGGSGGNDEIQINGDYTAGVTFNADTIQHIGYFAVLNGNSYSLTENDGNVAAGATMMVTGSILGASDYLHFYGAAETDGHFDLIGGAGDDVLEGGNLGDMITGGAGADTFLYTAVSQSTGVNYDTITGFAAGTDHFDVTTTVTGIFTVSGSIDSAHFDSDLAALHPIQFQGATIVTVTGGDLSGETFLVVDGNGDDTYTAGGDYVFDISGYTGTITTGDFI